MSECLLCLCSSSRGICLDCEADLPRIRRACPVCALPGSGAACGACAAHPPPWDACIAPFLFAFPLDRMLHAYKFRGRLYWARYLGREMAVAIRRKNNPLPLALVPVPSTPGRLARRGFNQALLLARHVGTELDLPVLAGAVARSGGEITQVGLDTEARHRNVQDAFRVRQEAHVPASVAIVDDLVTTGATAAALARALRAAGARRVELWAAARTPPR